jgi:response regulator of citrate/malate metabolism
MITTERSEDKMSQAIRLGSAAYFRKPFTAEQIQEKTGKILQIATLYYVWLL